MTSNDRCICRPRLAGQSLVILFSVLAVGLLPVTGCEGGILPSEAVIVDIQPQHGNVEEVARFIDDFLVSRGFARKGKDAYDEITQQHTVRDYARGKLIVSVALDQPGRVYVRVSERSEVLSDGAEVFIAEMSSELDKQYPGRTHREQKAIK